MDDESCPSIWSSLSGLRKTFSSRSTSTDRQTPQQSLPRGLSRKEQIRQETYEPTRTFADPDPAKSHLYYECQNFMNNLYCHPWSDPKRVQIPFGETQHSATTVAQRHHYRSLQELSSCVLCWMISDVVVAKFCGNSGNLSSVSHWRFVLKPT
jgi:hypothetical protein